MNKAEIEDHYFRQFCAHFRLPDGDVELGDKPDLIVRRTNSREVLLGIEQTRFFRESGSSIASEQIQSIRREAAIKQAEAEYMKLYANGLRLSLGFDPENPIEDVDSVARRITLLAQQIGRHESGSLYRRRYMAIPELAFVYVQWNIEASWQLTQVHSGRLTPRDQLQDIVRVKDKQAIGYRSCPELWLLVVIDFCDPAQDQEIDDKIASLESERFDKVILYKTVFNRVKEIPCTKPSELSEE